jgi:hypothetical protein
MRGMTRAEREATTMDIMWTGASVAGLDLCRPMTDGTSGRDGVRERRIRQVMATKMLASRALAETA